MSTLKVLEYVVEETDAGRRVALCVIVATHGSTPQPAGTMVCVDEAAAMTGTLGGGCVEADIRHNAHRALSAGTCELTSFALDGDFGHDDGMICGGRMDVAIAVISPSDDAQPYRTALADLRAGRAAKLELRIETGTGPMLYRVRFAATPRLLIAGAGHISRRVARIAMPLGFEVHVIDDRAQYANATRFSPPIRTHVGEIASTLGSGPLDPNTFVVIVTRGHKHDEAALSAVINSPVQYIGMIGSRRKIKVIFDDLRHEGIGEELLKRVHAPIGLDIGAVTTEEIAVSIAAQLVSIRRADSRCVVEDPFPVPENSP